MNNNRINCVWKLIESKSVNFSITPDYVSNLYNGYSGKRYATNDNLYLVVGALNYYIDKDYDYICKFLNNLSLIGANIIELFMNKYGLYINVNEMKLRLLESLNEEFNVSYPIPVYVSAYPNDKMTIGLLYFEDGKIEMFEGNDEASEETIKKVGRILGGKKIRIYGSHDQKIVNNIVASQTLPSNLYVSPDLEYASGYFGDNRVLFSGVVDSSFLNQESEYDWKTIENTPIEKIRLL